MADVDLKKLVDDMQTTTKELRDTHKELTARVEKGVGDTAQLIEKQKKCNDAIDAMDKKFQEWRLANESKKNSGEQRDVEVEEAKQAFWEFARFGNAAPERTKYLRRDTLNGMGERKAFAIGVDAAAGYLAPLEYTKEIIKGAIEFSPVRQLATVQTTSTTGVQVPKRTGLHSATWVAEAGTRAESTGLTYGLETILAHEASSLFISSQAQLEDAAFNLEAEITGAATEQFGVAEGTAFIWGTGAGQPMGILNTAITIGAQTCADSTNHYLQGKDIANAIAKLKEPYQANCSILIKGSCVGRLRTELTSGGVYVWGPLAADTPPTIWGKPYYMAIDLEDDGTVTKIPLILGDFKRGYRIVDRLAMDVVRDIYTLAANGQTRFIIRKRVGGQAVLPECFVKCTTA